MTTITTRMSKAVGPALPVLLAAFGLLLTVACFEGESRQTLYLEADGTVTWTVLERDLRSTAEDPVARTDQEAAFLEAARSGTHDAASALERLGGTPTTRVVRDEVPFTVVTEARFSRLDTVLIDYFDALGISATGSMSCGAGRCALDLAVEPELEHDEVAFEAIFALLGSEDGETLRLVRTEGRFLDAYGFTLIDKGRAAILDLDQGVVEETAPVRLLLAWSVAAG